MHRYPLVWINDPVLHGRLAALTYGACWNASYTIPWSGYHNLRSMSLRVVLNNLEALLCRVRFHAHNLTAWRVSDGDHPSLLLAGHELLVLTGLQVALLHHVLLMLWMLRMLRMLLWMLWVLLGMTLDGRLLLKMVGRGLRGGVGRGVARGGRGVLQLDIGHLWVLRLEMDWSPLVMGRRVTRMPGGPWWMLMRCTGWVGRSWGLRCCRLTMLRGGGLVTRLRSCLSRLRRGWLLPLRRRLLLRRLLLLRCLCLARRLRLL